MPGVNPATIRKQILLARHLKRAVPGAALYRLLIEVFMAIVIIIILIANTITTIIILIAAMIIFAMIISDLPIMIFPNRAFSNDDNGYASLVMLSGERRR